jgi:hypothetical protein
MAQYFSEIIYLEQNIPLCPPKNINHIGGIVVSIVAFQKYKPPKTINQGRTTDIKKKNSVNNGLFH